MVKMPVCFVGHGSPMNAIEENEFTEGWKQVANAIPTPKAILMISAHWFTRGTYTTDVKKPKMIYDMYGFPSELYQVQYPCPGAPELAKKLLDLFGDKITIDNHWGLDHGAWSVLVHMYPKHDIPVVQLSIDGTLSMKDYYELGRQLRSMRDEGILIIGSGNVVHNLRQVDWDYQKNPAGAYAVPTPDHYAPLLYILGAASEDDRIQVFNEKRTMGSLSMTSYLIG
ncbi:MAG: 4,5-DOPA dioxygenase extradiol [Firmicutes bacterium]|nr:4,5-DOPA dioxygenase extradiol [Bacillota bacterium]